MAALPDVVRVLPQRLQRRVSVSVPERVACARDAWQRHLIGVQHGHAVRAERLPAAVVRPETTEEVAAIVGIARSEGIPLVPFGAGSGVCGGIECGPRTLVIDTKRLRNVSRQERGPLLVVGPGALGIHLEEELGRNGFTLGHFPSSILCSTVGGWVATRGAGQCSGRYGKIEDMVTSAECVLGSGEVVKFRRRTSGLDVLPLLVGSEGALGIFTELELRLHRAPVERAFAAFELPSMADGAEALRLLFQAGLRPAVARLYDPLDSLLLGDESPDPLAPRPAPRELGVGERLLLSAPRIFGWAIEAAERTLLRRSKLVFVFEGSAGEAAADAAAARAFVERQGGKALGPGLARAWFARRYAISYRQSLVFRARAWNDTFEVAAPWSRLDAVYKSVRRALGRHALVMAHMSHAYPDGCSIYFTFVRASRGPRPEGVHAVAWRDALAAALEAGGTVSHHHGIGRLRAEALARELGAGGSEAHRALKRAWDPSGIMNPGSAFEGRREDAPSAEPPIAQSSNEPGSESACFVDAESGLARLDGAARLDQVEGDLNVRGLTLGLSNVPKATTDEWIAAGMAGLPDPWLDPVEQRLAGLDAVLRSGAWVTLRPTPRRATGPDLAALLVGGAGRIGRVVNAWLRVRPLRALSARPLPYDGERTAALTAQEDQAFATVAKAFGSE